MEEKAKSPVKKILNIIVNVILWAFVVFAVIVTILAFAATSSADGVPAIAGKCILTVQTPSMSPTFEQGDVIIGDKLLTEGQLSLEVGDIITFDAGDLDGDNVRDINSHRIVGIAYDDEKDPKHENPLYITKGDNNYVEDSSSVAWQYVICKYNGIRIKGVGKVLSFLQQPKGFLVCIVLPLVLFFFYELFMFIKKFLEVKNSGKKQISAADEELIKKQAIEEYLRQQKEAAEGKAEEVKAAAEDAAEKISDAVEDKAD